MGQEEERRSSESLSLSVRLKLQAHLQPLLMEQYELTEALAPRHWTTPKEAGVGLGWVGWGKGGWGLPSS